MGFDLSLINVWVGARYDRVLEQVTLDLLQKSN
jgi:hypothetical protein